MKVCYHIPNCANWEDVPFADEKARLERAIIVAIERAVRSQAQKDSEIAAAEIPSTATGEIDTNNSGRPDDSRGPGATYWKKMVSRAGLEPD